jgi:hypothetical protein
MIEGPIREAIELVEGKEFPSLEFTFDPAYLCGRAAYRHSQG